METAMDFYLFAKDKYKNIKVEFVSSEVIDSIEKDILIDRFKDAQTIRGTLGYHSFEPIADTHAKIKVKTFSLSSDEKTVCVTKATGKTK